MFQLSTVINYHRLSCTVRSDQSESSLMFKLYRSISPDAERCFSRPKPHLTAASLHTGWEGCEYQNRSTTSRNSEGGCAIVVSYLYVLHNATSSFLFKWEIQTSTFVTDDDVSLCRNMYKLKCIILCLQMFANLLLHPLFGIN